MNWFRQTKDGSLDRKFLRVCAVWRLLKLGKIGQARAMELLAERHSATEMRVLKGTVEQWKQSIPEMAP